MENIDVVVDKETELSDCEHKKKSPIVKKKDIVSILKTSYIRDIQDMVKWRSRWRKVGNYLECFSQFASLCGVILAFSAGFYNTQTLSFFSGCAGSVSLAFVKGSAYAFKESQERTESVNVILRSFGIKEIPEIIHTDEVSNVKNI